jgi:threonylcarbamoyladenosine tRNA methylthiotransferase MtaB
MRVMPATQPRAVLETIGCRLNQAESAVLAAQLKRQGYQVVESGEATDLLVLNTCSVTESAEKDCRYLIRRTLRQSPQAFVAVTGCYAQTGANTLAQLPGVDLIVGTQYKMDLPSYLPLPQALQKKAGARIVHTSSIDQKDFVLPCTGESDHTRAALKIQDGCNFMCAFCQIPFARGRERSRLLDDAVREAEELARRGHRELVLTGVNLGRYSQEGAGIVELIQALEAVAGVERIRISSIEPTTIPDSLLDHMTTSSKLCRFLHVPVQSGDDAILAAMNRRYCVKEYVELIERIVARVPDIGLGTDVLVGFPGEGEPQFANTVRLVSELPFSYFHVFSYSRRPRTAAARMTGSVHPATIKARWKMLTDLSKQKRLAFHQRQIGQISRVLFESREPDGHWSGLTSQFTRVVVTSELELTNSLRDIVITGASETHAFGKLVDFASPTERLRLL